MKTVYANAFVFDGNPDSTLKKACVWVENGKIIDITDTVGKVSDCATVDLTGKYLMPGLINAHCHLFGTGTPSKILGGGALQKKVIAFTQTKLGHKIVDKLVASAVKNQLMSGVTTLRSMGDFVYSDVRVRDAVRDGKLAGPRMLVSGPAITAPTGHGDGTFAMTASNEEAFRQAVRINAENDVDIIKICITGGVMDAKVLGEPGEVKMTLEQAAAAVDEAHKLGFKVASHTESPEGVRIAIKAKVDTIEHGSALSEDMADMLKEYGGVLVPTFSPAIPLCRLSSDITKMSDMCIQNGEIILQEMIAGAKDSIKFGLNVGCGTDASCPFCTQYDMWREARYFAKLVGTSNAYALSVATLGNAGILGVDDITGSIEVGKCADMIVSQKNPLEDIAALRELYMVVANGKTYVNPSPRKNQKVDNTLDELWKTL